MQYIHSDEIVNDVKNRLGTYFSVGKVDESIFPRVLRRCVGYMGMRVMPEKRTVVQLIDYKAQLPDDFNQVLMALLCSNKTKYIQNPFFRNTEIQVLGEFVTYDGTCNVCADDCGNIVKIVEHTQFDQFESTEFDILRPSRASRPYCSSDCFNFKSNCQDEFEIKEDRHGKVLHSTVAEGLIYLEYRGDLENEVGFMVPDQESVKNWIFEELRLEIYTYLWDNGEDVQQKMVDARNTTKLAHNRAEDVYRRPEIKDFYNAVNRLIHRFNKMERNMSHRYSRYIYR